VTLDPATDLARPVAAGEPPARRIRSTMGRSIERFLDTADTAPAGDEPLPERVVTALLQDAVRERASDIHLEPFGDAVVIRFRVDGALHDVTLLGSAVAERLANPIKGMAELDPVPTFRPQESRFRVHIDARDLDVRLTITPCLGGHKLVLRILDPQRVGHQLNELGLDGDDLDTLGYWVDHADGLFLAGLDFIGDRIIEVNAFSTGGLRDAERFASVDFCAAIVDAIEQRFERQ